MGFFAKITKARSARSFAKTPSHRSSHDLKIEAIKKLEDAVTFEDFREVEQLVGRIVQRFKQDYQQGSRENGSDRNDRQPNDSERFKKKHKQHPH
jgi:hypothetical protein